MQHIKNILSSQGRPTRLVYPRWILDLRPAMTPTAYALAHEIADRCTQQALYHDEFWMLVFDGALVSVPPLVPDAHPKSVRRALKFLCENGLAAKIGVRSKGTRIWLRGSKWRASSKRSRDRLSHEPLGTPMLPIRDIYAHLLGTPVPVTISRPLVPQETSKTLAQKIDAVMSSHFTWDPTTEPMYQVRRAYHQLMNQKELSGWIEWYENLPTKTDQEAVKKTSRQVLRQIRTGRVLDHDHQIRYCDKIYREIAKAPLLRIIDKTGTGEDEKN